ncbi:hypothetical protein BD289DRAFT_150836 [Coniella lustricola]|uniref:Uncharacterized protein n=1 Tax=Coniella lustricola TaxID=2025994 RepID=A0A2T3AET7_9PEZI|nr:hypothetical protein BD289DRAFT_150836 [Coniella lustricola]
MGPFLNMAPAVPGSAAVATSTVLVALQIISAIPRSSHASPTEAVAAIAIVLEFSVLALTCGLLFKSTRDTTTKPSAVLFTSGVVLSVLAAAFTAGDLISLAIHKDLQGATSGYLAGIAILLILSFILQLLFLVVLLLAGRTPNEAGSVTPGMQEVGRHPARRVKTVPYDSTSAPAEPSAPADPSAQGARRSSTGGFSATETIASITSSLTKAVRPTGSKARLLSASHSLRSQASQRSNRRAPSIESTGTMDSFDWWNTPGVDSQCRRVLGESPSPLNGSRFLETIPASPTLSRAPSPRAPSELDLEPPRRAARRSRSFSPASVRTALPAPPKRAFTEHTSASESHIHPLFRSDSPNPTPMVVSPGTIVIAAPQAGQVITSRASIGSLRRMRSDSLPAGSSPLNPKASAESLASVHARGVSTVSYESSLAEEKEEDEVEAEDQVTEKRKTAASIPDFILKASSRTSLVGYHVRKTESRDGPSGPGLDALPTAAA